MIDPTTIRLSKHFLLSDFMGSHSIYTRGLPNVFIDVPDASFNTRMDNAVALCASALEPILEQHGPVSISYGYISPYVSKKTVTYMNPEIPSHHRWDLGAAADICVHGWVNSDPDDDSVDTSPIALAHRINDDAIPYSRMITYSESPYICIAVSASEVAAHNPRKAFYENRWTGKTKGKPAYSSYMSDSARRKALSRLNHDGLIQGWRGGGYPSYHGGGRRQYHHIRTSKYTMLSDWLFDLRSIATGAKNMPDFRDRTLWNVFCAVGDAYDEIIEMMEVPRMSITRAYVSATNPNFDPDNDWRTGKATFTLIPPEGMTPDDVRLSLIFGTESKITGFGRDSNQLDITVEL